MSEMSCIDPRVVRKSFLMESFFASGLENMEDDVAFLWADRMQSTLSISVLCYVHISRIFLSFLYSGMG